jgi:hypothetical protein
LSFWDIYNKKGLTIVVIRSTIRPCPYHYQQQQHSPYIYPDAITLKSRATYFLSNKLNHPLENVSLLPTTVCVYMYDVSYIALDGRGIENGK